MDSSDKRNRTRTDYRPLYFCVQVFVMTEGVAVKGRIMNTPDLDQLFTVINILTDWGDKMAIWMERTTNKTYMISTETILRLQKK